MNIASKRFSVGEELANAISHGTGTILAVLALVFMLIFSINNGSGWHLAGSIVFGTTLFLLYLSSTLNHILPAGKAKEIFFTTDQIAIYLLIAGTYTPVAFIAFHGIEGWIFFGIEWGIAITGILLKLLKPTKFEKSVNFFIIISYIVMGWLIIIDIPFLIEQLSINGFIWMMLGGFFYTGGIIFFKMEKLKYHHLIWHLFVIFGSITHFIVIYFYVLPIKL